MGLVGLIAGTVASGLSSAHVASGTQVAPGHGLLLPRDDPRDLHAAAHRHRSVRRAPLDGYAQQCGVGRRCADVGALDAAPRCASWDREIRPYLLGTQFDAWHGLLRVPADWAPIGRAVWVCALYIAIPLIAGYIVFLRRDVAGD